MKLKLKDLQIIKSVTWADLEETNIEENCYRIATNILDHTNDYIWLYIYEKNGEYIITDEGYAISELEYSGVEISTLCINNILHIGMEEIEYKTKDPDKVIDCVLFALADVKRICGYIEEN
jgi:hypothetical protein